MNTKLDDKHEDQSPQNSKVSLVAEAFWAKIPISIPRSKFKLC